MAEESTETSRPLAEISHGPSAFEAFLDRNQKALVIGAILLALVGFGVIIVRGLKQKKIEEAGGAFGMAATVTELQQVIQKYADSPVAGTAKVVLADKLKSEAHDSDGAIETLRSFISSSPDHPAVPSAKASLASKLIEQGKIADAEPILRDLADDSKARYLSSYALLTLGDLAKAAGKPDEAEAFYKRIQELGPTFSNVASTHRRLVRFKMPVEVEPPAPAPAPAPGAAVPPAGTGELPNITSPDSIVPGTPNPGVGNPMEDFLKGGNPVPSAPHEEEPKQDTPPSEQPAPPVEQTPPP